MRMLSQVQAGWTRFWSLSQPRKSPAEALTTTSNCSHFQPSLLQGAVPRVCDVRVLSAVLLPRPKKQLLIALLGHVPKLCITRCHLWAPHLIFAGVNAQAHILGQRSNSIQVEGKLRTQRLRFFTIVYLHYYDVYDLVDELCSSVFG
jgi:hypothetical protein